MNQSNLLVNHSNSTNSDQQIQNQLPLKKLPPPSSSEETLLIFHAQNLPRTYPTPKHACNSAPAISSLWFAYRPWLPRIADRCTRREKSVHACVHACAHMHTSRQSAIRRSRERKTESARKTRGGEAGHLPRASAIGRFNVAPKAATIKRNLRRQRKRAAGDKKIRDSRVDGKTGGEERRALAQSYRPFLQIISRPSAENLFRG